MIQIIAAAFAAICASGQSVFTKACSGKNVICFNMIKSGAAFIIFALFSLHSFKIHYPTALFAMAYAGALMGSMITGYLALSSGPMSVTSLISSYSLIIPCIFGIAVLGEKVSIFQYAGFVILLVSMALIAKKDANLKMSVKWGVYVFFTFLFNGICSGVQKLHQYNYPGEYCSEFSVIAFALIFVVTMLASKQKSCGKDNSFAAL